MTIHKEGKGILFYLLVILVAINMAIIYLWPTMVVVQNLTIIGSIIFYLLILQFFRNPKIEITEDANLVLAPADGKVVVIEKTLESEHFNDERIQISIFMSPLNVHINRSPVAGIVKYFKYHPGKYLVAWHPKSSTENERTTMVLTMANGVELLVRQIAGAMARRIKWYVNEDHTLSQGQEFGFIKFGSRVDVFLPTNANILVSMGTKTKGGRTVLAELS
ncbi:MAG: phosphatidylserine decarboxylase family protein [Bacteroidetes bacterium]|nr:MAG: phosphatidylserine decarboxylase family protein [Bacteroidota bacterium]